MNCKPNKKVEVGRKTAALRVRQRQKRESLRWSPSGKLRTPHNGRSPTPTIENAIPWDDRFVFDVNTLPNVATHSTNRRISRKINDEKENVENLSSSSSNRIRHYTERNDGDAVLQFQQIDISASSGVLDGVEEFPSTVETRNIALSPFDMEKVKAALTADSLSEPKTPHEVESLLDHFEELILTMEIEEEIVRRDLELEMMNVKMKKKEGRSLEQIMKEQQIQSKFYIRHYLFPLYLPTSPHPSHSL